MFPRCRAFHFLVSCLLLTLLPAGASIASSPEERFAQLDANGDGFVTKEEFSAALPGMTDAAFGMLDKDSSSTISAEEWTAFSSGHGGGVKPGSMPKGMMPPPGMMRGMGMQAPPRDGAPDKDSIPLILPPVK